MIELNRILVPIDFSENCKSALSYAIGMAESFGAEIHLLHIIPNDSTLAVGTDGFFSVSEDIMADYRIAVDEQLNEVASTVPDLIKKTVQSVRQGAPFAEIVQYAKTHDIELIVMGTHGRSGITHLLIGSVAEKVVRKAPCPVLTVPPANHEFTLP